MTLFGRFVLVAFILSVVFLMAGVTLACMREIFKKIANHESLRDNESELRDNIYKIIDERLKFNDIPELVRQACKEYLVVSEDLEIDAIDIVDEDEEGLKDEY